MKLDCAGDVFDNLNVVKYCKNDYYFPKVVWSYWDNPVLPEDIEEMVSVTKQSLKNITYCFLSEVNVSMFINRRFPENFYKLTPQVKADYIRVSLLEKYGGVWIDTSVFVNSESEVEHMVFDAISVKAQFIGFRFHHATYVIQTAIIAAPAGSFFMKKYLREFEVALLTDVRKYSNLVCERFRDEGKIQKGDHRCKPYFVLNLMFLKIRDENETLNKSVLLLPQERGQMRLYEECKKNSQCFRQRLLYDPEVRKMAFVKIPHTKRKGKRIDFLNPIPIDKVYVEMRSK